MAGAKGARGALAVNEQAALAAVDLVHLFLAGLVAEGHRQFLRDACPTVKTPAGNAQESLPHRSGAGYRRTGLTG
jgi:hypothetical protein